MQASGSTDPAVVIGVLTGFGLLMIGGTVIFATLPYVLVGKMVIGGSAVSRILCIVLGILGSLQFVLGPD